MNERIKELHIQAQQHAFNQPIDIENCTVEDIKGFSQQVYEKFAELIVRECCEIAHCNFHVDGLSLGGIIKKHFGVE